MDRRRHQSIKGYIFIWILLVVLMIAGVFVLRMQDILGNQKQMQEMLQMHPEQVVEIEDSFAYYQSRRNVVYLLIGGVGAVGVTVLMGLHYGLQNKKCKKEEDLDQSYMECLQQQLEEFQKGNYQVARNPVPLSQGKEKAGPMTIEELEQWNLIWDDMIRLGHYFTTLKEQLEFEKNSTKTLISDISHQLKTPLASLRMSHELAQEENLTGEEREEFNQKEEIEIRRLEILLQELMNLSRLENHMIQITPENRGIRETITEAVNLVFMKDHAKQIELQVDMQADVIVQHDSK